LRQLREVPRLSVVIVNYRQWEPTAILVRQLRKAGCMRRGAAEVMVVDNRSPAHRLAPRLRRWPGVSLRRWGCNQGFARAANEGCRLSQGQWVLLLNPDVGVPDGFLEGVLALADRLTTEEPRTGIVGFQLRNRDGTHQGSSGPFPTFGGTLAGLLRQRSRRKYHARPAGRRSPVPWVTGCCLLIRRNCFRDLGGLDARFFLYYEDVDLCRRAQERGWTVVYEPALHVIHHYPLHARPVPPPLRVVTRHALLTYASKHWPAWQFRLLAGIVRGEAHLRRWWAWWRGDSEAASCFAELSTLAADMARGRPGPARQRLRRVVRHMEAYGVA
jgi:GT2 family glycosyltransferase